MGRIQRQNANYSQNHSIYCLPANQFELHHQNPAELQETYAVSYRDHLASQLHV